MTEGNWGAGLSHTGGRIANLLFSNVNSGAGLSHTHNSKNTGTARPREQCNSEALKYGNTADLTSYYTQAGSGDVAVPSD